MKLVTVAQMRKIEEEAYYYGISESHMMQQVAGFLADYAEGYIEACSPTKLVFLCGSGRNGQDAYLTAVELGKRGHNVQVFSLNTLITEEEMPEERLKLISITSKDNIDELRLSLENESLVFDGLFGTGLSRAVEGLAAQIINTLNESSAKNAEIRVVSIDVPSGLNADDGTVLGCCVVAHETVACGLGKIGLFLNQGPLYTGSVSCCDIGLPAFTYDHIKATLIDKELAKNLLPDRSHLASKNKFGKTLIVGGSTDYPGAPILAALGAAYSGTGITTLAQPRSLYLATASAVPYATHLPQEDQNGHFKAESAFDLATRLVNYDGMAIGCGVAPNESAFDFMWHCLLVASQRGIKTVADAGALHMLSQKEDPFSELSEDLVLTPHAGEMARLTDLGVDYISENKIAVALEYAQKWHKIVLLKGPNTVIASPEGRYYLSPYANSVLAVGGSGDVLSGSIASLMAQGMSAFDACALAVYLQGEAAAACAEAYARRGNTPDQVAFFFLYAYSELE